MAKFIKFTNVQPKDLFGNNNPTIEEMIVSTDQISSISKIGNRFMLSIKSVIIDRVNEGRYKTTPGSQSAIISKEDYENAKHILIGEAESAHVCNEHKEAVDIPNEFTTEETERMSIKKALVTSNGNRKVAAAMLGISERTLYRKIKEYDL